MKKRRIAAMMFILILALAGCGGGDTGKTTEPVTAAETQTGTKEETQDGTGTETAGTEEGSAAETEAEIVKEEYDALSIVDLGEYKGIKVPKSSVEVSDEELESSLSQFLSQYATTRQVKDRAVENGDTINLDYKGMKDGVAFDGGTAEGASLTIGSGSFIDGFEEGLIGVVPGESKSLNLTFPDPYKNNPDLAGQPVVFEVTVNYIEEQVTPELTDEFVQENSDYQTAEECREGLREELVEQKKMNAVLEIIVDQAKFEELPQNLVDYYTEILKSQMSYQAALYGMSYDEYLEANGYTDESFLEEYQENIIENAQYDVIMTAIISDAGLTLSSQEYQEQLTALAENLSMSGQEAAVEEMYGKTQLEENFLWNKACEYVAENAVVE